MSSTSSRLLKHLAKYVHYDPEINEWFICTDGYELEERWLDVCKEAIEYVKNSNKKPRRK